MTHWPAVRADDVVTPTPMQVPTPDAEITLNAYPAAHVPDPPYAPARLLPFVRTKALVMPENVRLFRVELFARIAVDDNVPSARTERPLVLLRAVPLAVIV